MIKAVMYDDNINNNIHLFLIGDGVHNTVAITSCSTMLTKLR